MRNVAPISRTARASNDKKREEYGPFAADLSTYFGRVKGNVEERRMLLDHHEFHLARYVAV